MAPGNYSDTDNQNEQQSLTAEDRIKLEQDRRKSIMGARLMQGSKRLPLSIGSTVSLGAAAVIAWMKSSELLCDLFGDSEILLTIARYAPLIIILIFYLLLLAAWLVLLGTPFQARSKELAILKMRQKFTDSLHCPVLLSYMKDRASMEIRMVFYSPWIDLERWINFKNSIQSALKIRLTEDITTGKNDHYIVLVGVSTNTKKHLAPPADMHF